MPPQGALREISPVFLCRIGQETVQDIVTRTMEIFQITRATQVPTVAIVFSLSRAEEKKLINFRFFFSAAQRRDSEPGDVPGSFREAPGAPSAARPAL